MRVRQTKRLLRELDATDLAQLFARALEFHKQGRLSEEAREGLAAFREHRRRTGRSAYNEYGEPSSRQQDVAESMPMSDTATATTTARSKIVRREQQVRQAEELLFSGPQRRSLAKELFWGRLAADLVLPYPQLSEEERPKVAAALARTQSVLRRASRPGRHRPAGRHPARR